MVEAAAPPIDDVGGRTAPLEAGPRRYVLALLMIAYTLSFLDRQVLSILVEPIKNELKVGDAAMGLLTGPVFVIFYTFLGIPIAWLADRRSRPVIITVCLTLWSAFTAMSGLASSFVPLALARLGVGFGEAGCNPSSHSLIADISRGEQRASGLAFYSLGVPIGTLLGLAMGGLVADAYGWRAAFMVAGLPGLALAALIGLTVKEPRPRAAPGPSAVAQSLVQPFRDLADTVRALRHKPSFWFAALATGFSAFVGYGLLFFNASFFLRCHGAELAQLAGRFRAEVEGLARPRARAGDRRRRLHRHGDRRLDRRPRLDARPARLRQRAGGGRADRGSGGARHLSGPRPLAGAGAAAHSEHRADHLVRRGLLDGPERRGAAPPRDRRRAAAADPQPDRAWARTDVPRRPQRSAGERRSTSARPRACAGRSS